MKFGKIYGRFFLKQHLDQPDDDTPDLCTISELIETYPMWPQWVHQVPEGKVQLYTMFETSDVHPDIIEKMKVFDKVIVPFDYLKDILVKHGVKCEAVNWYTSPLVSKKPTVIPKTRNPEKIVFLYVGTNDVRKNTINLVNTFVKVLEGTKHILIMKTNNVDGLIESPNIKFVTEKISLDELAGLYNICDYMVSFTRGEGVGLPMLEAQYFNKPVIAHDQGVFVHIKDSSWITLPCKEVSINYTEVPEFLKKVFYGTWWEIDYEKTQELIISLIKS
jgi:glycosyltransferase involved in cell wall biosynthesis|tara:strand:+ start:1117 stop:1944 length:828 start_codon:yes stop_codon:yes gene_type:complete